MNEKNDSYFCREREISSRLYEAVNGTACVVEVNQNFIEHNADEILELLSHIKGSGESYTRDILRSEERFGNAIADMWQYSEATINPDSGHIINLLLAGEMFLGQKFKSRIEELSGRVLTGSTRIYISELATRPGLDTRGKGYASAALERLLTKARNKRVEVCTLATELSHENKNVVEFYEKRGFEPYGFFEYPLEDGGVGQDVHFYKRVI